MANSPDNNTIDITNRAGVVIVDHPEFQIEMTPEEAEILAGYLMKHAKEAKVRKALEDARQAVKPIVDRESEGIL